jgi:hypothetical protein
MLNNQNKNLASVPTLFVFGFSNVEYTKEKSVQVVRFGLWFSSINVSKFF